MLHNIRQRCLRLHIAASLGLCAAATLMVPAAASAEEKQELPNEAINLSTVSPEPPCPDQRDARRSAAPFIEAMLEPGHSGNLADLIKGMGPDALAEIGKLQNAAEEQRKMDWANLCRYQSENAHVLASGIRPEVIFLGDSITENWKLADPSLFSETILGRGIGGQTTPQILLRFYQDVVALRPRAVHIMAGTNDIAGNTGPSSDKAILDNFRAIIDIAAAHRIAVVLASIPPSAAFQWNPEIKPAERIARLNRELGGIAQERGITFVDYGAVLADPEGAMIAAFGNDGVHPNRDGYAAMRPLAENAIGTALHQKSKN